MGVGLDIAMITSKSSILTRQKEMAIISNNISRANDPNFHRETALVESNLMVQGDYGYYGTGCHVSTVVRHYDEALEDSLRSSTGKYSYSNTYSEQLSQLEDLMSPQGTDPLNEALMEFAANIQNVASNPESIAERTAMLASAETLSDKFNQQYESLKQLRDHIANNDATGEGAISQRIEELNSLLNQIIPINDEIRRLEQNVFRDQSANTLRDDRDKLVAQISEYINISVTEESDYTYTITFDDNGTTRTLVDGTMNNDEANYFELEMDERAPATGLYFPRIELINGSSAAVISADVTLEADTGEIKALLDAREYIAGNEADTVDGEMKKLYQFAYNLGDLINTQQAAGYDLDGNGAADPGFVSTVFTLVATQPASGTILSVNSSMKPRNIAASDDADETGNGDNARDMWDVLNTDRTVGPLTSESFIDYSNRFAADIAQDVSTAMSESDTRELTVQMFQNAVFEVSAVNTDDEMTEMLEVQRAFQAAAKLISTVDQMMSVVLSLR